jgi:predicted HicB family RNase H-like nuclease
LEGIRDRVTYEATDVVSLQRNFEEAVDDYLKTCQKKSKATGAYKGSFNVRVGSDLHKRAAALAVERHKKLNTIVSEALEHYLESPNC